MKKVAIINSYNCGSTGKIACKIGDYSKGAGYEVLKCFPRHTINIESEKKDQLLFGIPILYKLNAYLTKITGLHGFFQFYNTKELIRELEKFDPDLVNLHNIHSSYVNLKILFKYLSKKNISVVWTLHDCWAITGRCAHFDLSGCKKWEKGCHNCRNHFYDYPKAFLDTSKIQWKRKKRLFNSIKNLTLVTPSVWLNNIIKSSFLSENKSVVIRNGIDHEVFKPLSSDFRKKYGISEESIILLGVTFGWNYQKGLDVFIELSKILPSIYKIVMVGTDDNIDKLLPTNIISIHRTLNQVELAEIYTAADIFLNPTREEMLGMTNIEANACGTPVITYNTGGSPECINEKSGYVFKGNTVGEFSKCIQDFYLRKNINSYDCIENSKRFNEKEKYDEYVKLFDSLIKEEKNENSKN